MDLLHQQNRTLTQEAQNSTILFGGVSADVSFKKKKIIMAFTSSLLRSAAITSPSIEASRPDVSPSPAADRFKVSFVGSSQKIQKSFLGASVSGEAASFQKCSSRSIQPIKATATQIPLAVQKSPSSGKTKVGINGFGQIGRLVLRVATYRDDIDVVAVNDQFVDAKYMAYMFKYDSTHGVYDGTINVLDESTLEINGKQIKITNKRTLRKSLGGDYGADFVVESSGIFTIVDKALAHKKGGAKKVIISAPSADAPMFVV